VENCPERITIRSCIDGSTIPTELLRSGVRRRSEKARARHRSAGFGALAEDSRETEIYDSRQAIAIDKNVRRFEIAMDDAALMRMSDSIAHARVHTNDEANALCSRVDAAYSIGPSIDWLPVDPLHHDRWVPIDHLCAEYRDHIRMAERCSRSHLGLESIARARVSPDDRREHFQRNDPARAGLDGLVHDPLRPAARLQKNVVAAERAQRGQRTTLRSLGALDPLVIRPIKSEVPAQRSFRGVIPTIFARFALVAHRVDPTPCWYPFTAPVADYQIAMSE